MTEDELTTLIATAREKFIDLGQEPLDGCSMEKFIAREILKDDPPDEGQLHASEGRGKFRLRR